MIKSSLKDNKSYFSGHLRSKLFPCRYPKVLVSFSSSLSSCPLVIFSINSRSTLFLQQRSTLFLQQTYRNSTLAPSSRSIRLSKIQNRFTSKFLHSTVIRLNFSVPDPPFLHSIIEFFLLPTVK